MTDRLPDDYNEIIRRHHREEKLAALTIGVAWFLVGVIVLVGLVWLGLEVHQ